MYLELKQSFRFSSDYTWYALAHKSQSRLKTNGLPRCSTFNHGVSIQCFLLSIINHRAPPHIPANAPLPSPIVRQHLQPLIITHRHRRPIQTPLILPVHQTLITLCDISAFFNKRGQQLVFKDGKFAMAFKSRLQCTMYNVRTLSLMVCLLLFRCPFNPSLSVLLITPTGNAPIPSLKCGTLY